MQPVCAALDLGCIEGKGANLVTVSRDDLRALGAKFSRESKYFYF